MIENCISFPMEMSLRIPFKFLLVVLWIWLYCGTRKYSCYCCFSLKPLHQNWMAYSRGSQTSGYGLLLGCRPFGTEPSKLQASFVHALKCTPIFICACTGFRLCVRLLKLPKMQSLLPVHRTKKFGGPRAEEARKAAVRPGTQNNPTNIHLLISNRQNLAKLNLYYNGSIMRHFRQWLP